MFSQVFIQNTDPVRSFTYDYAYGPDNSNEELYEGAVKKIVRQLFEGMYFSYPVFQLLFLSLIYQSLHFQFYCMQVIM